MDNSYINQVKEYWESIVPKGRSNKKMLWFTIYSCIRKQCIVTTDNECLCPICSSLIDYDIDKRPYCNYCGQKLKK